MKQLLIALSLVAVTASPALAHTSNLNVQDHYKTIIKQVPYNVEVCKYIKIPYGTNKEFDKESAIIGGLIGGVIGNQFGKGSGKEAATGVGALTGAIIGGTKDKGPAGYRTEEKCSVETRYKESEAEVYSHSTATFWHEGKEHIVKFFK